MTVRFVVQKLNGWTLPNMKNLRNDTTLTGATVPPKKKEGWSEDIPAECGIYEFECMENGHKAERVPIRRREGILWALLDGIWNPLEDYHNNLTDCRWRLKGDELMAQSVEEASTEQLIEELALRLRTRKDVSGETYRRVSHHLCAFAAASVNSKEVPAVIKQPLSLKRIPPGNQPREP